ncbi:MAG: amylo-alpha-1,6-glucosidase [Candidatus Bathyarchaeia archaeon]
MRLPRLSLTEDALADFDDALHKEWLITNGLGGYSASTVLGLNTRKYHGLLVAALHPPGDRTVCLAKLDEDVQVGNTVYQLGANEFHGKIFPQGYLLLKEFSLSPFPSYTYIMRDAKIEKMIFMPKEKNAVAVVYDVLNSSDADAAFRIFPLVTCRHFHSVIDRWRTPLSFSQQQRDMEVKLAFDMPKVIIAARATAGCFIEKPVWIERLYYREEASRGESSTDDCYQPGYFEVIVQPKRKVKFAIISAAGETSEECMAMLDGFGCVIGDVEEQFKTEIASRGSILANFYGSHSQVAASDWLNWLLMAADTFLVKSRGGGSSVLAGYFWFETWGRDMFISLPGLMLATGRLEEARQIFLHFMAYCRRGLIPNYVEDKSGEAVYNTVDATLWYINAVLHFLKHTGDFTFVQKQLWDGLKAIVDFHEHGTDFSIHLDSDGLLAHGPRLTWMDAEVDGKAVTPRAGKAVEIQALWYNALKTMQRLAERFGEQGLAEKYAGMAHAAQKSFNKKFWNSENGCLFDVIDGSGRDATLRPNQIIAVALDFIMLDAEKCKRVVEVVHRELLTPFGLRTLAAGDPRYRGMYVGDRRSRDQAYHNGTVWPWLLGPYVAAVHKTKSSSAQELQNLLMSLFTEQLTQAGLGTLSEIFDGDPPHTPRGCIAQAWSVAEPLRAYLEDVLQIRPKYEKALLQF